jgi:hypothetical protein
VARAEAVIVWFVQEEFWIPLVDEPIGEIVAEIEEAEPEIREALDTPHKLLAFRTFSYIRVGLVLGRLLVDREEAPHDAAETWVEALYRDPEVREEVVREVRKVAEEVMAEAGPEESLEPDDSARARFRAFARETLE